MKRQAFFFPILLVLCLLSCSKIEPVIHNDNDDLPEIGEKKDDGNQQDEGNQQVSPYTEGTEYGVTYIYDRSAMPQVHINVEKDEWNTLLGYFQANSKTKQHIHCDVSYIKGSERTDITDAGLRLRGNTSRKYPGSDGSYHHCHFGLNFTKYQKDEAHEIHGARKINLKWFKDDATYAREIFCYDMFRRDTVWTAIHAEYCRLFLKVEGDSKETYLGVYEMLEPIDGRYLKERKDAFGGADGNLWKCRYGATLSKTDDNLFGLDVGGDEEWVYECKSGDNDFEAAKAQFADFINNAKSKTGEDFENWLESHCDVDLLIRTYAVNVACGMWDDYWNNCNNYYVYFNSTSRTDYKFFFIPYDYDNTLGTSLQLGNQSDSGRQNPLTWGTDSNYFIKKVLSRDKWMEAYKKELLKLVDEDSDFISYEAASQRIMDFQSRIMYFVSNDTGEDMKIEDRPASWGNHAEYRLLEDGDNNFFRAKTASINKYCK